MSEAQRKNYAFYDGGSDTSYAGIAITTDPVTTTFTAPSQFISITNTGSTMMFCVLLTSKNYTTDAYPAFTDAFKTISLGEGEKFSEYVSADGVIIKTLTGSTNAKIYISW